MNKARSKDDMRASEIVYPKEYLPPPPGISNIDFQPSRCLNQIKGGWPKRSVTLDSEAIETVGPPEVGDCFPLTQMTASEHGINDSAANGSPTKELWTKNLTGCWQ